MKLLVTGATGFIGQHLLPLLIADGYKIIAVARNRQRAERFYWFDSVDFIFADIHNVSSTTTILSHGLPDAVIHLAWPGLPDYKNPLHLTETMPAQYRFLSSLLKRGVKHLLVTGTCFEYGMQEGCLVETMPAIPTNAYGLAKHSLYLLLRQLQDEMPFVLQWARLFYTYGEGQNENSLMAQLKRAIDSNIQVFNMSLGEQLRDYLPVNQLATKLLMLFRTSSFDGVINVCSGKAISVRRLVENYIESCGSDIKLNLGYFKYPDYEPLAFWGDNELFSSNMR